MYLFRRDARGPRLVVSSAPVARRSRCVLLPAAAEREGPGSAHKGSSGRRGRPPPRHCIFLSSACAGVVGQPAPHTRALGLFCERWIFGPAQRREQLPAQLICTARLFLRFLLFPPSPAFRDVVPASHPLRVHACLSLLTHGRDGGRGGVGQVPRPAARRSCVFVSLFACVCVCVSVTLPVSVPVPV